MKGFFFTKCKEMLTLVENVKEIMQLGLCTFEVVIFILNRGKQHSKQDDFTLRRRRS